jgi:tetratricopeptide (TPR) repeat protein
MKHTIILIAAILFSTSIFAQSDRFVKGIGENLTKLKEAESLEEMQAVANGFERIASVESEEWLAHYYVGYTYIIMGTVAMEKAKDKLSTYIDKAQEAVDKALELAPEESEVYALQGYVYQGRIWENPMVNGARYSPMSMQACQKAIALNPENPRPYYLNGQNTFYMPEFFGGGAEKARPMLEKAAEKFDNFEKESTIHPDWGEYYNTYLLKQAKGE